jgi:hypothetical protein
MSGGREVGRQCKATGGLQIKGSPFVYVSCISLTKYTYLV